jgi:hypothetical protein
MLWSRGSGGLGVGSSRGRVGGVRSPFATICAILQCLSSCLDLKLLVESTLGLCVVVSVG